MGGEIPGGPAFLLSCQPAVVSHLCAQPCAEDGASCPPGAEEESGESQGKRKGQSHPGSEQAGQPGAQASGSSPK